jgi:hypothetical protein
VVVEEEKENGLHRTNAVLHTLFHGTEILVGYAHNVLCLYSQGRCLRNKTTKYFRITFASKTYCRSTPKKHFFLL